MTPPNNPPQPPLPPQGYPGSSPYNAAPPNPPLQPSQSPQSYSGAQPAQPWQESQPPLPPRPPQIAQDNQSLQPPSPPQPLAKADSAQTTPTSYPSQPTPFNSNQEKVTENSLPAMPKPDSDRVINSLDDYLLLAPRLAQAALIGLGVALLALFVRYLENNVFYVVLVVPGIKIPWSTVFIALGLLWIPIPFILPFIADPLDRWLEKDENNDDSDKDNSDDDASSKSFAEIFRGIIEEKKAEKSKSQIKWNGFPNNKNYPDGF